MNRSSSSASFLRRFAGIGLLCLLAVAIVPAYAADCNGNGVPDDQDLEPTFLLRAPMATPMLIGFSSADIDGDGLPDLVGGIGQAGHIEVLYQRAPGTPFEEKRISVDGGESVVVADMDGDSRPDLVVTGNPDIYGKAVTVVRQDGSGGFTPAAPLYLGQGRYPTLAIPADLDGDGDLDLVLRIWESNEVVLVENLGAGLLAERGFISAGSKVYAIAVAASSGRSGPGAWSAPGATGGRLRWS